ncbi:uncharacterized protein LOC130051615 [Ostrea edulis]|uniref:uncharacterized protein LOC130051615 n=1 Tax=Ostrea edulis TaxID=37623 RepID=UPI0024AF5E0B|nr:uncharacterized protein LOC130051615 [Ostrea edulis]
MEGPDPPPSATLYRKMACALPLALFLLGTLISLLCAYQPYPQTYPRDYQQQRVPILVDRMLKRTSYQEQQKRMSDPKYASRAHQKRSMVTILCNLDQCKQLMAFLNRTMPSGYPSLSNL